MLLLRYTNFIGDVVKYIIVPVTRINYFYFLAL